MSDATISADIVSGIRDAMADLGSTLQVRDIAYADIDINNPGSSTPETITNRGFEGLVFDFNDKYMPGSTVADGDRMVLVSVDGMTPTEIATVKPGNYIIDGSEIYSIIKAVPIKVAGSTVVVIAQVKS